MTVAATGLKCPLFPWREESPAKTRLALGARGRPTRSLWMHRARRGERRDRPGSITRELAEDPGGVAEAGAAEAPVVIAEQEREGEDQYDDDGGE